jgi:hypothetical protein
MNQRSASGRTRRFATNPAARKPLLAWAAVGLPILWGVWITLSKALILFR